MFRRSDLNSPPGEGNEIIAKEKGPKRAGSKQIITAKIRPKPSHKKSHQRL